MSQGCLACEGNAVEFGLEAKLFHLDGRAPRSSVSLFLAVKVCLLWVCSR